MTQQTDQPSARHKNISDAEKRRQDSHDENTRQWKLYTIHKVAPRIVRRAVRSARRSHFASFTVDIAKALGFTIREVDTNLRVHFEHATEMAAQKYSSKATVRIDYKKTDPPWSPEIESITAFLN